MKYRKVQIENAKSFAKYDDFAIESIKSLYLSADDLLEDTSVIELVPKNPPTLKLHSVIKRFRRIQF